VCAIDGANLQVVAAAKVAAKEGGGKHSWPSEKMFWDLVDQAVFLLKPKFISAPKSAAATTPSSGRRSSGPAPLSADAEMEREKLVEALNGTVAKLVKDNKALQNKNKEARARIKELEAEKLSLEAEVQQLSESGSTRVVSELREQIARLEGQVEGMRLALQRVPVPVGDHSHQTHHGSRRRRSRSRSRSPSCIHKDHRRHHECSCERCMHNSYD
jgi:hypothetical protein